MRLDLYLYSTIGWLVGTRNQTTALQKYYITQRVVHGLMAIVIVNTETTGRKN